MEDPSAACKRPRVHAHVMMHDGVGPSDHAWEVWEVIPEYLLMMMICNKGAAAQM